VQELRVVAQDQRVAGLLVHHLLVLRVQRGHLLVLRVHLGLDCAGGEEAGGDAVDAQAPGQEQRQLRQSRTLVLLLLEPELVIVGRLRGRQRSLVVVNGEGELRPPAVLPSSLGVDGWRDGMWLSEKARRSCREGGDEEERKEYRNGVDELLSSTLSDSDGVLPSRQRRGEAGDASSRSDLSCLHFITTY
jgi:hypothetical protein